MTHDEAWRERAETFLQEELESVKGPRLTGPRTRNDRVVTLAQASGALRALRRLGIIDATEYRDWHERFAAVLDLPISEPSDE